MKTTTRIFTLLACSFSAIAMATANSGQDDGNAWSVLETSVAKTNIVRQDPVQPPIPLEPTVQSPVPAGSAEMGSSVMVDQTAMYPPMISAPVAGGCCEPCCKPACRRKCRCSKPAPVPTLFCLVDPCGCSHEACVDVPVCCVGEQPTVSWRQGVAGRQIATLCWACCDNEAKVVVTGCGKVRVRD